jgi:hypothetical protein
MVRYWDEDLISLCQEVSARDYIAHGGWKLAHAYVLMILISDTIIVQRHSILHIYSPM